MHTGEPTLLRHAQHVICRHRRDTIAIGVVVVGREAKPFAHRQRGGNRPQQEGEAFHRYFVYSGKGRGQYNESAACNTCCAFGGNHQNANDGQ